jgi:hypothetical protein
MIFASGWTSWVGRLSGEGVGAEFMVERDGVYGPIWGRFHSAGHRVGREGFLACGPTVFQPSGAFGRRQRLNEKGLC